MLKRPSVICFILMAIVLLSPLVDPTGLAELFFGLVPWSVVLVNLGFLFVLLDVFVWRSPRWLLILPIGWFGGYAIVTSLSHIEAGRFYQTVREANVGKHVDYDWQLQDLVLSAEKGDASTLSYEIESTAEQLVKSYSTERVYLIKQIGPDRRASKDAGSQAPAFEYYFKIHIVERACQPGELRGRISENRKQASTLCSLRLTEDPVRPIIQVKFRREVTEGWLTPKTTERMRVIAPDKTETEIASARAAPLYWLPVPFFLYNGWQSRSDRPRYLFEFMRENTYYPPPDVSREPVLAAALGLKKQTIRERHPDAGW